MCVVIDLLHGNENLSVHVIFVIERDVIYSVALRSGEVEEPQVRCLAAVG